MNEKRIPAARKRFNEQFSDLTEAELQLEILYMLKAIEQKNEKIRSNTSTMVWFFIVIPLLVFLFTIMSAF